VEATTWAEQLSQAADAEIRWNWEGEVQGHYVSAPYTLRLQPQRLAPKHANEWRWDLDYSVQWPKQNAQATLLDDLTEGLLAEEYRRGILEGKASLDTQGPVVTNQELKGAIAYLETLAEAREEEHRATIVIPTESEGDIIPTDKREGALNIAQRKIAEALGGFTGYEAQGGWLNGKGEIVKENVTVIEAYSAKDGEYIENLLHSLAAELAATLNQDCVLWTIDGKARFTSRQTELREKKHCELCGATSPLIQCFCGKIYCNECFYDKHSGVCPACGRLQ
jgi:hypothetical protein